MNDKGVTSLLHPYEDLSREVSTMVMLEPKTFNKAVMNNDHFPALESNHDSMVLMHRGINSCSPDSKVAVFSKIQSSIKDEQNEDDVADDGISTNLVKPYMSDERLRSMSP